MLAEREIEVHRFEETWRDGDRRGFEIECSSGTYVRSLIADLGDAYCEQLRRTAIGRFKVAAADPDRVVPLPEALEFLPAVRLDPERARGAYGQGVSVPGSAAGRADDGRRGPDRRGEPVAGGAQDVVELAPADPGRLSSARAS